MPRIFPLRAAINLGQGQDPGSATATTSSSEIVPANPSRRWCIVTNIGNKDVWLSFGKAAEVDKGFLLAANGGSLDLTIGFNTTEAINGITSAATSDVAYQEGV